MGGSRERRFVIRRGHRAIQMRCTDHRDPALHLPGYDTASLFASMTSLDLEASRLLDRTGVCGARRGMLSKREKVTGRAFDRQIGSTKRGDRYADCRIRTGFAFDRHICYAPTTASCHPGNLGFIFKHGGLLRMSLAAAPQPFRNSIRIQFRTPAKVVQSDCF